MESKIVVVGAGAAGIACATRLVESGFEHVIVLEAEKRIGGRILTVPFGENVVDLGAMWCHGEADNVVHKLASPHKLLEASDDIYCNVDCVYSNRFVVPDLMVFRMRDAMEAAFELRDMSMPPEKPLELMLAKNYFSELKKKRNNSIHPSVGIEFYNSFLNIDNTRREPAEVAASIRTLDEYWECPGAFLLNWKNKGFAQLFKIMLKENDAKILHGILRGKIKLDTKVRKILWSSPTGKIDIICGETKYTADHVVVTVSLGVLKARHRDMFLPELPLSKVRAIENLSFTNIVRVYLEFPKPFWSDDWFGFQILWREEELTAMKDGPQFWMTAFYGFFCVDYQPKMLTTWAVGSEAITIEKLPEDKLQEGCLLILRRFLNWHVPNPIRIICSNWHSQANFLGGFSYRSVRTELAKTGATELSLPLLYESQVIVGKKDNGEEDTRIDIKPSLLFAGEATSSHHYSTVHGAVESGWREADRIIGYHMSI